MKFNKLIPELTVSNLADSLLFYLGILKFELEYDRPESNFAFISKEGTQLMLQEPNGVWETGTLEKPFGRGINFQIEVAEIEPLLNALKIANISLFKEPMKNWYRVEHGKCGNNEFLVQDPDGYLLRFSKDLGFKEA